MTDSFAVAVLTPTTGLCRMGYAQSLARMIMYFSQVRIFEDVQVQHLVPDAVEGSGIAENYERMVTKYLKDEAIRWTHFLSVEDDMAWSPDCLHILARRRLPIVGANYSTNKGSPLRFTAVGMKGKRLRTTAESTGVEEVCLLPQGFTLVAREVYETLPKPWFLMGYNQESGNYVYQDYYFSQKARDAGYKLYVDQDVSKLIYHTGPKNYEWSDALKSELKVEKKGNRDGKSVRSLPDARRRGPEEPDHGGCRQAGILHRVGGSPRGGKPRQPPDLGEAGAAES